jgi:multiple sugar transport system permease protein
MGCCFINGAIWRNKIVFKQGAFVMQRILKDDPALAAGKRRRKIREALVGYVFVLPATLATFLFGLWPVIAGFYESLKSGSPITNKYVGLNNYVRSMGSLTYVLLLAVVVIFTYLAYRYWQIMRLYHPESGGALWPYLVPGMLAGAGLITWAFIFVTGIDGYSGFPVIMLLLAAGGFFTADQSQNAWNGRAIGRVWLTLIGIGALWIVGPRIISSAELGVIGWLILLISLGSLIYRAVLALGQIRTGRVISAAALMGLFMLLAILLGRYTVGQMENQVEEAQEIADLIFNQNVLNATVLVADENARISGLSLADGDVVVEVQIDGETIQAPLAPEVYNELPADKISRLETAFANNQKVQVVLPDGTIAEGTLTGLPMGEKFNVAFSAEDPQAVREISIYSALDVGEGVIQSGGHTEPFIKQVYAVLTVFLGMAAIYMMTGVRRQIEKETQPRLHAWLHIGRVIMTVAILVAIFYLTGAVELNQQAASGMGALNEDQFDYAYEYATGQTPHATIRPEVLQAQLLYWPQVLSIGVGAFLIGIAYLVWQSAQQRETPLRFGLTILLAVTLMVGGWLLLGELPRTLHLGGRETEDALDALTRTAMYSVGTVPVQLALGLFLAYLLFSEVKLGKSLFRVIYFMPYIAPSVATSTVFLVIFRFDSTSLANRIVGLFGFDPQTWLKEPQGIVRIFYEQALGGNPLNIPEGLAGPSLALTTVILYNIWVFAGYNSVVFLAGLGSIPTELYEAAEVDGAGRWARFRSITLPLLSPTTFFLSMLSIIGTFKAFAHIYVLRGQSTGKEIDTMSVHIFNVLYSANDPGYAAALAFVLFGIILVLTFTQNRLAREQVFYG